MVGARVRAKSARRGKRPRRGTRGKVLPYPSPDADPNQYLLLQLRLEFRDTGHGLSHSLPILIPLGWSQGLIMIRVRIRVSIAVRYDFKMPD